MNDVPGCNWKLVDYKNTRESLVLCLAWQLMINWSDIARLQYYYTIARNLCGRHSRTWIVDGCVSVFVSGLRDSHVNIQLLYGQQLEKSWQFDKFASSLFSAYLQFCGEMAGNISTRQIYCFEIVSIDIRPLRRWKNKCVLVAPSLWNVWQIINVF